MTNHPHPRSFDRAASLPAVAPETPAAPTRHDGWTPARQAAFLRELSASHNVAVAARAVGMSRQSAYQLRARMQGQPFDKAWQAAFLTRFDVLAEAALDRALNGVEVQHYYKGELIGTSRKYDERLTLGLLAMRGGFAPPAPHFAEPASAFEAEELGALIERVEQGPDDWRGHPNEELDMRYGGDFPPPDRREPEPVPASEPEPEPEPGAELVDETDCEPAFDENADADIDPPSLREPDFYPQPSAISASVPGPPSSTQAGNFPSIRML